MRTGSGASSGRSANHEVYATSLRYHVHEMIWMGYQRLKPADYTTSEEPDITGELVRAMHDAIQDDDAPDWAIHYELPKDDPPLNVQGRRGKRRPRVDIEFVRVSRGTRPRFRFEAKRLGLGHPVGLYLGEEGMGRFLSGKYPVTHEEAGMLGYVQSRNEQTWADKLEAELERKPEKYAVREDGPWERVSIVARLHHTYRSRHDCGSALPPVTICQVLLRFC